MATSVHEASSAGHLELQDAQARMLTWEPIANSSYGQHHWPSIDGIRAFCSFVLDTHFK